jgi:hypothetical protein
LANISLYFYGQLLMVVVFFSGITLWLPFEAIKRVKRERERERKCTKRKKIHNRVHKIFLMQVARVRDTSIWKPQYAREKIYRVQKMRREHTQKKNKINEKFKEYKRALRGVTRAYMRKQKWNKNFIHERTFNVPYLSHMSEHRRMINAEMSETA